VTETEAIKMIDIEVFNSDHMKSTDKTFVRYKHEIH